MNIAFVINPIVVISGKSNGIKAQAETWRTYLKNNGHTVVEVNPWHHYDWKDFDVVHIFGTGFWIYNFVRALKNKNQNIFLSPIIDSTQPHWLYKLNAKIGSSSLRLWSPTFALLKTVPLLKGICVRSNYEAKYIPSILTKDKVHLIPLGTPPQKNETHSIKKNYCLHISSIWQPRKNVVRLIEAAKKYNFNLVLAGSKGTESQFEGIKKAIGDAKNITVLGFVSEEEKIKLYAEAKVFALPSINEGVGIVALEAATYGCEIAITNIGGPKEYFEPHAEVIDPYNIDDIGTAVLKLLKEGQTHQPKLAKFIASHFSEEMISTKLETAYSKRLQ